MENILKATLWLLGIVAIWEIDCIKATSKNQTANQISTTLYSKSIIMFSESTTQKDLQQNSSRTMDMQEFTEETGITKNTSMNAYTDKPAYDQDHNETNGRTPQNGTGSQNVTTDQSTANQRCNEDNDIASLYPKEIAEFARAIMLWLAGIVCIIGVLGNGLSITVLHHDESKGPSTFYLKALAILDLLSCSTYIMFDCVHYIYRYTFLMDKTSEVTHYYERGYTYTGLARIYFMLISSWVVVVMTLDRYIAVCKPLKAARLCTVKRAKISLAVIVIISMIVIVPRAFELTSFMGTHPCTGLPQVSLAWGVLGQNPAYRIAHVMVIYSILMLSFPTIITAIFNAFIIYQLKQQAKNRKSMMSTNAQISKTKVKDGNLTKTLATVSTLYVICFMPLLVFCIWDAFWYFNIWSPKGSSSHRAMSFYFLPIVKLMTIVNSMVNFFVYFFIRDGFRKRLINMVLPQCILAKQQSSNERPTSKSITNVETVVSSL
ncbi:unnamed protein product [Owenia fusiformis]|uniref:Uncharacterized protein n=1 Tax=Owenia fusiformis TaxID=6347 RepID=A0A8J1U5N1_OWEFU|nr:unnamed protein product [Owenia fusiformis]